MNDSHNEQIFDSMLEEVLTNQHPPDLTEVIQQRLRQELGPERFQQLREGRWTPAAATGATQVAQLDRPSHTARSLSWRTVGATVAALAACLMLAVGLWSLLSNENFSGQQLANQAAGRQPGSTVESANNLNANDPQTNATEVAQAKPSTGKVNAAIELPLDKLPFDAVTKLPEVVVDRPGVAQAVARLSDQEIVAWVDSRFATLWNQQKLGDVAAVPVEEVLARINRLLADSNSPVTGQSPGELAGNLVRTAAFAENWAERIADYWLKGSALASETDPAAAGLRTFLAQQIVARRPWNEVLSELVGSAPNRPAAGLLVAHAGNDNHRLAGRLGSLLLDEALACARCHDASDNGRVITTDQDEYWSLVAIFTGLDVEHQPGNTQRTLVDRQAQLFQDGTSPNVFFDRPDGRLQAAYYRLPGGDNWRSLGNVQTPRESLARWIATTSVTDQASVNMAWRIVFGRPLVAQHSAMDGDGLAARREVLAKLAEQFRAYDRDMGKLVTWLVASRPYASQTIDIDRSRWLAASDVQVEQWQQAVTNFAAQVPARAVTAQSLDRALALVDNWSGNADDRRAMLAQPVPVPLSATPTPGSAVAAPENKSTGSEPPASYLVRAVHPTAAQRVFIKRLTGSKLSWSQQVDHIAGLVGEPAGNAQLHSAAQKALDARNGDRSAALFQLLQAAMLCQESM